MIPGKCPFCQATMEAHASLAGQVVLCPFCNKPFQMPGQTAPAAPHVQPASNEPAMYTRVALGRRTSNNAPLLVGFGIALLLGIVATVAILTVRNASRPPSDAATQQESVHLAEREQKAKAAEAVAAAAEKALADRKAADERVGKAKRNSPPRTAEDPVATEGPEQVNTSPAESYKQFCRKLVRAIDQEEAVTYTAADGRQHRRAYRMASQSYAVDLQKTTSLISPIVGKLEITVYWIVDGERFSPIGTMPIHLSFVLQDGKWKVSGIRAYHSLLDEWLDVTSDTSYSGFFQNAVAHAQKR